MRRLLLAFLVFGASATAQASDLTKDELLGLAALLKNPNATVKWHGTAAGSDARLTVTRSLGQLGDSVEVHCEAPVQGIYTCVLSQATDEEEPYGSVINFKYRLNRGNPTLVPFAPGVQIDGVMPMS